jgi:hypothetical protein
MFDILDEQANPEPSKDSNVLGVRRDYRRSVLSLLECKLCGKTFSRITHFHTENKHGISLEEYRKQFPYAPTESESWRKSQKDGHLGQVAWNVGLTKETSAAMARQASSMRGNIRSLSHSLRIGQVKKEQCQSPYYALKTVSNIDVIARNVRPTNPEKQVLAILERYFPNEWKYVGNGEFSLGRLVPDFMNVDGKKKLIEVFGDYWHKGENPEVRIARFEEYGFKTLILWEHEIRDTGTVIRKIQEFCKDNEIVHPSVKIEEQGVLVS